ncbi:hypothetical protein MKW98_030513 [Papaver atlanticum]|uniref:Uncharacterized protein n=1 Tax=Papaver atlanticum TaxID=357466 RepID=A0AAD4T5C0_9MAGN|nr:hypothetical protein MKW98_030513 [Papaver atlanticum]
MGLQRERVKERNFIISIKNGNLKGHKMYFCDVKGASVSFEQFKDMVKDRLKYFFDMWRDVKPDQWGYVALTVEILGSSCDDMGADSMGS